METIISTKGIKKGFPIANGETFWALKGIDLEIAKGQLTILKGRSGSGKTTLMNILSALDAPTEGDVMFQGTNIALLNEKERSLLRRTKIGFAFQSVALIPMMTAFENVEYALRMAKYQGDWKARAEECLRLVDMGKRLHHLPQELSGGEQQRIAIAIALANNPKILLADEPTGSVDTKTGNYILDVFRELNNNGMTVVVVTHDRMLSKKMSRVVTIRDGKTSSEMILKQSYTERLNEISLTDEPHNEYAVLDRAGRVQLPKEFLENLDLKGNKVCIGMENGRIVIGAPETEHETVQ